MRRLVLAWLAVVALLLGVFVIVEMAGVPLLTDPGGELSGSSTAVALVGVGLLVIDALLPVASSAVMVLLGAAFGVAGGTVLSTVGALGSLALAAHVGRRGQRRMGAIVGDDGPRVADLLSRYGTAAVILSRPVPLLAESVAVVAGAAGMGWWRLLLAGTAGIVPASCAYAAAGDRSGQAGGVVVAGVVVALAAAALGVSALRGRRGGRARPLWPTRDDGRQANQRQQAEGRTRRSRGHEAAATPGRMCE